MTKVKGQSLAGGGIGALAAWIWGLNFPDTPMPPEIAAVVGSLLGPILIYIVAWIPEAPGLRTPGGETSTGDGRPEIFVPTGPGIEPDKPEERRDAI